MTPDPTEAVAHHHLPVSEVRLLMGTDGTRGLDPSEAVARLHRFGPNPLPPAQGPGALRRWLSQFNHTHGSTCCWVPPG